MKSPNDNDNNIICVYAKLVKIRKSEIKSLFALVFYWIGLKLTTQKQFHHLEKSSLELNKRRKIKNIFCVAWFGWLVSYHLN